MDLWQGWRWKSWGSATTWKRSGRSSAHPQVYTTGGGLLRCGRRADFERPRGLQRKTDLRNIRMFLKPVSVNRASLMVALSGFEPEEFRSRLCALPLKEFVHSAAEDLFDLLQETPRLDGLLQKRLHRHPVLVWPDLEGQVHCLQVMTDRGAQRLLALVGAETACQRAKTHLARLTTSRIRQIGPRHNSRTVRLLVLAAPGWIAPLMEKRCAMIPREAPGKRNSSHPAQE